jgi:DNA-binding transcriptional LysR family regulator
MDFRRLRYFVCLYEEANITRAAVKLNLVQPALSMQIQRLELELKLELFERTPRGVVATPAAQALYELYRPILIDLRNANERVMALSGKVLGKIAVGIIPSITNSVLADALSRFGTRFPEVDVRIDEAYSGTLIDWVANGDLDFAVVNRTRRHTGISSHALVSEELLLVHRRRKERHRPKPIPFAELVNRKLVLPSRRHGLRMIVEQIAEERGLSIVPKIEVDALAPTLKLVAESDLMAVLPSVVVRKAMADAPLQATRIVDPRPSRELVYAHRTQRTLSLAASKFLEILTSELKRSLEPAHR